MPFPVDEKRKKDVMCYKYQKKEPIKRNCRLMQGSLRMSESHEKQFVKFKISLGGPVPFMARNGNVFGDFYVDFGCSEHVVNRLE